MGFCEPLKIRGNHFWYLFCAIANLKCHPEVFVGGSSYQPAWHLCDQPLLLLPSHARWTKQFSRETETDHFSSFVIQFVSDNPLVLSDFPPSCQW